MNDLISVRTSTTSMTSREIAELTGKRHDHVLRDIDNLLKTLSPDLGSGFLMTYQGDPSHGYRFFHLDRDASICLVTGYDVNSRMKIIKRWQELEANAKKAVALPDFTNPAEAARAWASEYEAKQAALVQLEAAQPAIEFHERVGDADSLHSIDEAAKALQAPPRKFRQALKSDLGLFRLDGLPKQDFIDRGYVRVVEQMLRLPQGDRPYPQTFFTGKGLQWIQRKLDHSLMGKEI